MAVRGHLDLSATHGILSSGQSCAVRCPANGASAALASTSALLASALKPTDTAIPATQAYSQLMVDAGVT